MKTKRTIMLILIPFVLAGLLLSGCEKKEEVDLTKVYELKLATAFSPMHTLQVKVFEPWAKEIEEMSNGRLIVTFFPGGALGKAPDHYDIAADGIADITYTLQDYTPGRFPLTNVFELPFMVGDAAPSSVAMWKVYEEFPDVQKEYADVKVLALFCHPGGSFHMVTKPITRLDDLQGTKIRTASPFVTDALKLFGAAPVTMPITETYTSLSRSVVDGTVSPWEGVAVFKFDEVIKYSTPASFYTMTMIIAMNKDKYESLPADLKKIIDDTTGLVMSERLGKAYDAVELPLRDAAVEKGVEIVEFEPGELDKLRETTFPMREQWVEEMSAKGYPAQDILDAAIKYTESY